MFLVCTPLVPQVPTRTHSHVPRITSKTFCYVATVLPYITNILRRYFDVHRLSQLCHLETVITALQSLKIRVSYHNYHQISLPKKSKISSHTS